MKDENEFCRGGDCFRTDCPSCITRLGWSLIQIGDEALNLITADVRDIDDHLRLLVERIHCADEITLHGIALCAAYMRLGEHAR